MNTARKRNMPVFCCVITFVFCLALNQSVYGAEAWRSEWERTIKAAESEGEVSYYTLGEFGFLSAFEKKFPRVKVKVVQGRGNELLARIMTERRAGKYLADVARLGNTSPFSLYQAKVLQPVASAFILPEVKDESKWWSGKHQYVDSDGKYIFVPVGSVSVNMVAHNTELVSPAELSSFWDLLNEKWRGKIVVMDPRSGGYGRSAARTVFLPFTIGRGVFCAGFLPSKLSCYRGITAKPSIGWLRSVFSILVFGNGDDVLQAKAQGLPVNVFDTSGWKEGGTLEPGAFTWFGWTNRLTPMHPRSLSIGSCPARVKWRFNATERLTIRSDWISPKPIYVRWHAARREQNIW